MIKLFVGLGNPGAQYEATRHNAGFWWLDALAARWRVNFALQKGFQGLLARAEVSGHSVWLLKPQTFMNLSGHSVAALARFYKIAPEQIVVAHDELDLPSGQAKLKCGGGHAGHNGLRDIHAQLSSPDYWRLRLGIGPPGVKAEVIHWVLQKPSPEQRAALVLCIERTLAAADALVAGDTVRATQIVHTDKPPRAKPPRRDAPPLAPASGG